MRCRRSSLAHGTAAAAATLALALSWLTSAAAPAADSSAVWRAGADTTLTSFVLVRHAEKDTRMLGADVPLNARGFVRAQELVRVLGDVRFRHIYVTPWQRNRQTAEPLASRRGDSLTVIDDIGETLRALRAEPRGSTVLVVGHSNTLPQLIEGLTGRPFPTPERVSYDGLWIVTRAADGTASLLALRYGAPDEAAPEPAPAAKPSGR
jgi:phosphohistidine phosphatase SixA